MKKIYLLPELTVVKLTSKKPVLLSASANNLNGEASDDMVGMGHETDADWDDEEY